MLKNGIFSQFKGFCMKKVLKLIGIIAFIAVIGFSFVACDNVDDGTKEEEKKEGDTPISSFAGTWNASGNRSIVFSGSTFNYRVNGTTQYSGTFSVSGSTITFNATGLGTAGGNFTLLATTLVLSNHTWDSSVNGTYTKDSGDIPVTLNSVTPNGNSTQTTTQLTLNFSQAITGLSATDITLTGVSNVNKGTLSNSGATYTLPISGFTTGGQLSVSVTKTGYEISGSPKTATIYYYSGSSGSNPFIGTWNNNTFTEVLVLTCTEDLTWSLGSLYSGTYTYNGNTGTFILTDGSSYGTITISGNIMTVNSQLGIWTFTKDSGSTGATRADFYGKWQTTSGRMYDISETAIVYTYNADTFKLTNLAVTAVTNANTDYPSGFTFSGTISESTMTTRPNGNTSSVTFLMHTNKGSIRPADGANISNDIYTKYVSGDSGDPVNWTAVVNSTLGTGSTNRINGIAYGNNKFVAGDDDGKIAYSSDGINWTAVTNSTFSSSISGIAWGNNKFVAVGYGGKMAYSSDGINWTAVTTSTFDNNIYGIVWGNNKFVAVGRYGKMATSSDGVTWTAGTDTTFSSTNIDINGIAWGNNKFVAVGKDSRIAYSSDGITWTRVNDTFVFTFNSIAWGNNKFVAVGGAGTMAYSSDGITWTKVNDSTFGSDINGIAWGNNKFVAVGQVQAINPRNGKAAYSSDGITWTEVTDTTFGTSYIIGIAYGNNKFVAVGQSGKIAYSSGN